MRYGHVTLFGVFKIVIDHMLYEQRVALAVRQVEKATQAVRHGMHRAKYRVGEGESRFHTGKHDLLSQPCILLILQQGREVLVDEPYRIQGIVVRHRTAADRDKCLDGMNQRIDTGAGGKIGVHGMCGLWIDQCNIRYDRLAHYGDFNQIPPVGDNAEL